MTRRAVILLVEDNAMDVELTLDAFEVAGLENPVRVCRDGEDAVAYLRGDGAYADRQAYPRADLVLLDLKLPKLDGFEVLRQLKSDAALRRTPVIVLTSSPEEGDRALSYDLGVNSYLVKPVRFSRFVEVVREIGAYWLSLNVPPPPADDPLPPGREDT